jgi:hypothetical protein
MKFIPFLILLVLGTNCSENTSELPSDKNGTPSPLEQTWVVIKTEQSGGNGYRPGDGVVVKFEDGKLQFSYNIYDTTKTLDYKIIADTILVIDTLDPVAITQLSQDTLKIDWGSQVAIHVPVPQHKINVTKDHLKSMLFDKTWIEADHNQSRRIEFSSFLVDSTRWKEYRTTHTITNYGKRYHRAGEAWTVMHFDDNLMLGVTSDFYALNAYQITKVKPSRIEAIRYSARGSYPVVLEESLPLDSTELQQMTDQMCSGKRWDISELDYDERYQEYEPLIAEGVFHDSIFYNGYTDDEGNNALHFSDFMGAKYYFSFLNNTKNGYLIWKDYEIVKRGIWTLTPDGKYIKLEFDSRNKIREYIEIIEVSDSTLKLGLALDLTDNVEEKYIELDCQMTLTPQKPIAIIEDEGY